MSSTTGLRHGGRQRRTQSATSPSANGWTALLVFIVWWTTIFVPNQVSDVEIRPLEALEVAVLLVATVGIVGRHRSPLAALLLTTAADLASVVFELDGHGYHYAGLFGVFCAAMRFPLATTVGLVSVPMGLVYFAEVYQLDGRWLAFAPVWVLLSTSIAVSFGQVRYLRERLLDSLQERVESAEAAQEAMARTRVAEDRLQTARDLHDVVGHRIAVVHLRAAVAIRALENDPEAARRALVDIDDAAKAALTDIDQLLSDLRTGDSAGAPGRDLRDLGGLLTEFRRYGLDVHHDIQGDLASIAGPTAAVAYQVIVESLTNAYKHGGAHPTANLHVRQAAGQLDLTISNPSTGLAKQTARSGWGLHGLRERITAVNGTLTLTPGTDFVVTVSLPLARAEAPPAPEPSRGTPITTPAPSGGSST